MDRRVFILPVASIILILVLLSRPDITGFMTAKSGIPPSSEISVNVSVTIAKDGFIPEDSLVTVYLDDRNSSMGLKEFIRRTGIGYSRVYDKIPRINYQGYGYAGEYEYTLGVSEFGLDTYVEPGVHRLAIEVIYENYILSNTSQDIQA